MSEGEEDAEHRSAKRYLPKLIFQKAQIHFADVPNGTPRSDGVFYGKLFPQPERAGF